MLQPLCGMVALTMRTQMYNPGSACASLSPGTVLTQRSPSFNPRFTHVPPRAPILETTES